MTSTEVGSTEVAEVIIDLGHTEEGKKGSREWVFTINNWTIADSENLRTITSRYICWAPEVAPKTGTPHLQGYVVFKDAKTRKAVSKIIPRAYLAARSPKSSPLNCRTYIFGPYSKDGKEKPFNPNAVEVGTLPHQGERNDLKDFHEDIEKGKRGRELSENHLAVRAKYPRLEETLIYEADQELAHQRYEQGKWPVVHVRWGKPRVGKTRYIYDKHGVRNCCTIRIRKDGTWWAKTSCAGKSVLILDDFYGQMDVTDFLQLLDKYPYEMEKKGGFVWRNHDYIYITSNRPPDTWYPEFADQKFEQILGRLTSVTEVTE